MENCQPDNRCACCKQKWLEIEQMNIRQEADGRATNLGAICALITGGIVMYLSFQYGIGNDPVLTALSGTFITIVATLILVFLATRKHFERKLTAKAARQTTTQQRGR